MSCNEHVKLKRDVEGAVVPIGTRVLLQAGEEACVTQSLGGNYTVVVNGNMFLIEGKDADALGLTVAAKPEAGPQPTTPEALESQVWSALRTCYDPEIPVNIVDLGLVYDCAVAPTPEGHGYRVEVKMTLTAPGCGMGPMIQQDAHDKLMALPSVQEVSVELVWDPPWNQGMLTEAAKLQLGLL